MSVSKSVHAVISGRVQGVWFRAWTVGEADKLGLLGWVRNRTDGTVEALFQGPSERVEAMLVLCRKGPPLARVDAVAVAPADAFAPTVSEGGFRKLPTV